MISAASVWWALFCPVAIASAGVLAYPEASRSAEPQSAKCDDAVSLLRTSHEITLGVDKDMDEAADRSDPPTTAPTDLPEYVQVTQGTCEESYKCEIPTMQECEEAATKLGLPDTSVTKVTVPNRNASGCLWKYNSDKLLWNTMSIEIGAGAGWPFNLVCINKPPVPTPSPTPGVCVGDTARFRTGYGDCPSYGRRFPNHRYCTHDEDLGGSGLTPSQVCPECGRCQPASGSPTPAPTTQAQDNPNPTPAFCLCPPVFEPVCGTNGVQYGNACIAGCLGEAVECNTECPCGPTATGDPHVRNLAGEHFDINRPADHELLRVPLDPWLPALLEMRGLVNADDVDNACALYIRMVTLRGEWFGNSTLQVRPLHQSEMGLNAAGNATTWPFSIRASTASIEGDWRSVADFGAGGTTVEVLSAFIKVAAWTRMDEFGSGLESQAFEIMVGRDAESHGSILVFQAPRQSLNLQLSNLKALGEQRLGGLLGTESHSSQVEEKTDKCKARQLDHRSDTPASEGMEAMRRMAVQDGLRLSASW